jgi:hypothetical protein
VNAAPEEQKICLKLKHLNLAAPKQQTLEERKINVPFPGA